MLLRIIHFANYAVCSLQLHEKIYKIKTRVKFKEAKQYTADLFYEIL